MHARLALGATALVLVTAACVAPVENDEILEFDPAANVMGRIQEAGEIRVGIPSGDGPFAVDASHPQGFTVELAREVAGSLGVEVDYVTGTDDELAAMVGSGAIDLAFPLVPITERALSEHSFSDPYWIGRQKILTFDDSVLDAAGLAGRSVCQSIDAITGVPVQQLAPEVGEVIEVEEVAECPPVDAVVAPDIRLLGLMAQGDRTGTLLDEELNAAGYGAMVSLENRALADYVDVQLLEAKEEGRWIDWFARYVSPLVGTDPPNPPGMHLEEAAALFPAGG